MGWLSRLLEHCYYLLPLCVHAALPILTGGSVLPISVPSWIKDAMAAPLPIEMQQLHVWGWLFTPMVAFALGSYCLDSKNSFCFFPGTPYFHRVVQCNIIRDGEEQEKKSCERDIETVREWAMKGKPALDMSTHWWYKDLPTEVYRAFDRIAHSAQVK